MKSIAIPNDLREWPTTALNNCTNLQTISVYGPESDTGHLSLTYSHGLPLLTHLVHITLPSTVTFIGESLPENHGRPTFPSSIQTFCPSKNLTAIGAGAFINCHHLKCFDFSRCLHVQTIFASSVRGTALTSLNLSGCSCLMQIGNAAFFFCNNLRSVIFPPSLRKIETAAFETGTTSDGNNGRGGPSPVQTIVWKGRTGRPELSDSMGIHTSAFVLGCSLDRLVAKGSITEIYAP